MFKKRLLISLLILTSSVVSAGGGSEPASITSVGVGEYYTGQCGFSCMVFIVNPAPTGSGSCSYSSGWHFAIDLNSPEASSVISTILSAKASGGKIGVKGSGVCTSSGGIEKVYYVFTM